MYDAKFLLAILAASDIEEFEIPEFDGFVCTGCNEAPLSGTKGHGPNLSLVSVLYLFSHLGGGDIEDLDSSTLRSDQNLPVARCKERAETVSAGDCDVTILKRNTNLN